MKQFLPSPSAVDVFIFRVKRIDTLLNGVEFSICKWKEGCICLEIIFSGRSDGGHTEDCESSPVPAAPGWP